MAGATPTARRGISLPFVIVASAAVAVFVMIMAGQDPWAILFINPLINALILLDIVTFGNFGLAIILFTVLLRVATIPFTIRQLQSTRAMQAIQPELQEIQKKYKDPKRRQEEMMRLYKENSINPLGCFMPLLIQMVVFMALYRSLVFTVGGSPESLVGLSQRLYPIGLLEGRIPLNQHFIWLNLGQPDPTFVLPILVGISTYLQQRLSVTPNASAQQQQQQQMLTWMMPMMLMFITLNLPSGVGVYWVVSNVFSLIASYYVYGRRILSWRQLLPMAIEPVPEAGRPAAAAQSKSQRELAAAASDNEPTAGSDDSEALSEARSEHAGKRRGKRKKRR
jgi:YidC/Oxa1 family membrane protein insertase